MHMGTWSAVAVPSRLRGGHTGGDSLKMKQFPSSHRELCGGLDHLLLRWWVPGAGGSPRADPASHMLLGFQRPAWSLANLWEGLRLDTAAYDISSQLGSHLHPAPMVGNPWPPPYSWIPNSQGATQTQAMDLESCLLLSYLAQPGTERKLTSWPSTRGLFQSCPWCLAGSAHSWGCLSPPLTNRTRSGPESHPTGPIHSCSSPSQDGRGGQPSRPPHTLQQAWSLCPAWQLSGLPHRGHSRASGAQPGRL